MVDNSDMGYPTLTDEPLRRLREVFATRMEERFGWRIQPERVEVLQDVVQGIFAGLRVFAGAGNGVIVQPPVYPPFLQAVADAERRLVLNQLQQGEGGHYDVDFAALEASIDGGTRILLLCNPHNPTGRVFTRDELSRFAEIAERHDLVIISDEIHADITYPGYRHIPIASLHPDVARRTITLTSATKSFSIPGLRFAVGHFGDAALQRRFCEVPATLRGGVSAFGLQGTLAAWRHGQPWLEAILSRLEENRQRVMRFAHKHLPEGRHPVPEATYLAWLDCRALPLPPGQSPYDFFLDKARVALGDGGGFGPGGAGFVRLNFATSQNIITQIFQRMAEAIYRLQPT